MFTIKSVSDDGIYYLVNGWEKYKRFWVELENLKPDMMFKTAADAKRSLTKLLKIMYEYLNDDFELVNIIMKYKIEYCDNSGNNDYILEFDSEKEAEDFIQDDLKSVKGTFKNYDYADFGTEVGIWEIDGDQYASWKRCYY